MHRGCRAGVKVNCYRDIILVERKDNEGVLKQRINGALL